MSFTMIHTLKKRISRETYSKDYQNGKGIESMTIDAYDTGDNCKLFYIGDDIYVKYDSINESMTKITNHCVINDAKYVSVGNLSDYLSYCDCTISKNPLLKTIEKLYGKWFVIMSTLQYNRGSITKIRKFSKKVRGMYSVPLYPLFISCTKYPVMCHWDDVFKCDCSNIPVNYVSFSTDDLSTNKYIYRVNLLRSSFHVYGEIYREHENAWESVDKANKIRSKIIDCTKMLGYKGCGLCMDLLRVKFEFNKRFMSRPEFCVYKILNNMSKVHPDFYFFYSHKWSFLKFIIPLEFDFYCVTIHSNKIINWVIEVDSDYHFSNNCNVFSPDKHRCDVLKQCYLSIMGIHLLRLQLHQISPKTIDDFFARIINSDTFVIDNKIIPDEKCFCFSINFESIDDYYMTNLRYSSSDHDHNILVNSEIFFHVMNHTTSNYEVNIDTCRPSINASDGSCHYELIVKTDQSSNNFRTYKLIDSMCLYFARSIIDGALIGSINYYKPVKNNEPVHIDLDSILKNLKIFEH